MRGAQQNIDARNEFKVYVIIFVEYMEEFLII